MYKDLGFTFLYLYVYPVAFLIFNFICGNLNNQGLKNIVFQPYEIGKEGGGWNFLYFGVAAFMREFQGSTFVWW